MDAFIQFYRTNLPRSIKLPSGNKLASSVSL